MPCMTGPLLSHSFSLLHDYNFSRSDVPTHQHQALHLPWKSDPCTEHRNQPFPCPALHSWPRPFCTPIRPAVPIRPPALHLQLVSPVLKRLPPALWSAPQHSGLIWPRHRYCDSTQMRCGLCDSAVVGGSCGGAHVLGCMAVHGCS